MKLSLERIIRVISITSTSIGKTAPAALFHKQLNVTAAGGPRSIDYSHKYGSIALMKTTLEIPDAIFRRAKSVAAERGIPLREFVTEAVKDKLAADTQAGDKPWVKHMGKLKRLRKETLQINRLIEEDSEKIDPEMWR